MRIPIVLLVTIAAGAAGFSTGLLSRAPRAAAPNAVDALPSPGNGSFLRGEPKVYKKT